jgi:hypothetical protein
LVHAEQRSTALEGKSSSRPSGTLMMLLSGVRSSCETEASSSLLTRVDSCARARALERSLLVTASDADRIWLLRAMSMNSTMSASAATRLKSVRAWGNTEGTPYPPIPRFLIMSSMLVGMTVTNAMARISVSGVRLVTTPRICKRGGVDQE